MKSASPELIAHINAVRASADAALFMADCYTITLLSGASIHFTNLDQPVTLDGNVFRSDSLLVDGLKYKCQVGLNVDQQKITIIARPSDLIAGEQALAAIQSGVLDGAEIRRDRAFMNSLSATDCANPIGSILLFKGRVGKINSVGRTQAEITVNSDLVLLDLDMPRNVYAPACDWILYGFGCGLLESNFSASGTVGAGATTTFIPWTSASGNYAQGRIVFTSGLNEGLSATIKSGANGGLTLMYPLAAAPPAGDGFTASFGCDHTLSTCESRFNNRLNFRGFPFIPPPTFAA